MTATINISSIKDNVDLYDRLKAMYPKTFKEIGYIECDIGWSNILACLASTIEMHLGTLPPELSEQIFVVQIKQKFGELRWYMSEETPVIRGAIDVIENLSRFTCEVCGNVAQRRNVKRWISTLCDSHYLEAMEKVANSSGA
jgi:hypothetical protein